MFRKLGNMVFALVAVIVLCMIVLIGPLLLTVLFWVVGFFAVFYAIYVGLTINTHSPLDVDDEEPPESKL